MKSRSIIVLISLVAIVVIDIAAAGRGNDYQNLQVLPKDISSRNLQHIMVDEFQDGLGVGCNYCHANQKSSMLLDYASDEKPEKLIARQMMQMTIELNKNHFGIENPELGSNMMAVTCATCHRGSPHPEL